MKVLKKVSLILAVSIAMWGVYSFTMPENKPTKPECGDVSGIDDAGNYSYGSYTTTKYKISCECGQVGYIYYNEQKGGWCKTSSVYVDYTTSNTTEGLKKAAKMYCSNND